MSRKSVQSAEEALIPRGARNFLARSVIIRGFVDSLLRRLTRSSVQSLLDGENESDIRVLDKL